jgi:hypothetical protein
VTYKEATTADQTGFMPVSITWAKKHILGFSDEELKLDLQQQRIERAVGAELTNTATIITKTGIFDNIDKLYGSTTGTTEGAAQPPSSDMGGSGDMGSSIPPPPLGGAEEPAGGGLTPESNQKDNLNILLESDNLLDDDSYIDLSKARNYLGEIESQLNKLLNS